MIYIYYTLPITIKLGLKTRNIIFGMSFNTTSEHFHNEEVFFVHVQR